MFENKSDDYKSSERHFLRAAKIKYLFQHTKSSRTIVKLTRHIVRELHSLQTLIIESKRKEKRKEGKNNKEQQTVD